MADVLDQLILQALLKAAAKPDGLPLHGTRSAPGLFPTTAAGKQAASACKEHAFLHTVRTETRGKSTHEICALSEKGLAQLLTSVDPRQVLERLTEALAGRESQFAELIAGARAAQTELEKLRALVETVLEQLRHGPGPRALPSANGSPGWQAAVLARLQAQASALQDCPLPELYQAARQRHPHLTIGQFHDGLRDLYAQEKIYLHPWTGPLYELPEPSLALLVGHEIAYYASSRTLCQG